MYKYDRLPGDNFAYVFVFSTANGEYGTRIAKAILKAMQDLKYTGSCEYYAGNYYWIDDYYRVGLGIEKDPQAKNAWEYFKVLSDKITLGCDVDTLIEIYSELTYISSVRAWLPIRGVINVKNGLPTGITDSQDSFFMYEVKSIMEGGK